MSKDTYNYSGVPSSEEYKQKNFLIINKSPKGNLILTKLAIFLMATTVILLLVAAVLGTYFLTDHLADARCHKLSHNHHNDFSDNDEPNSRLAKATVLDSLMLENKPKKKSTFKVNYRLPTHLKPKNYTLQLTPYVIERNFTTDGNVVIDFTCLEKSSNVTLNVKEILIDEQSVRVCLYENGACNDLEIRDRFYDDLAEQFIIRTKDTLQAGKDYQVRMHFLSKLNNLLQGFYRSSYLDGRTGDLKWMASTQFSPTDARRAFPSFDEPSYKAKFKISIARDRTRHLSLSNMPVRSTQEIKGIENWVWDHYEETPIMSTYLVAFVVSDLKHSNQLTQSGVNITFWSRPDAINQTFYSSILVPKALFFLEKYFGSPFPLRKMDLVAIPDFGFSAMENWGLITFRETALLWDPVESMVEDKQNLASTISHELGHQWFGNLVTPAWWDDLWLKEGFATFAGYLAVNEVERSWNFMDQFVVNELHSAFSLDSLSTTHAISSHVDSPAGIRQMFDAISYKKGASLIRMMSHFLGENSLKNGLRQYLNKYQYGNARQDDLWETLQEHSVHESIFPENKTVKHIMDTWTLSPGYPLVTIIRDYDNGTADIKQKRFLFSNSSTNDKTLWYIPITYVSQNEPELNNTKTKLWFTKETDQIESLPKDGWFLANLQSVGYYRVNYDEQNWRELTDNYYQFSELTRTQLISDAMNIARGNELSYDVAMMVLKQISKDFTGFLPWRAALKELKFLYEMLAFSKAYGDYQVFASTLVQGTYSQINFDEQPGDTDTTKIHRDQILHHACKMQNEACRNRAQYLFREWMIYQPDPRAAIKANLRSLVYCTAIREGGHVEWDFLFGEYIRTNIGSEKSVILDALGCTSKQWLLHKYLEMMLDEQSPIRKQDGHIVFQAVAQNIYGAEIAVNFLFNNWDRINQYYGEGFNRVSKMVEVISTYLTTQHQLDMVVNFQEKNKDNLYATEKAFKTLIQKVSANVEWTDRSYDDVARFLKSFIERYGLYN